MVSYISLYIFVNLTQICSYLLFVKEELSAVCDGLNIVQSKSTVEALLGLGEVTARLPANQIPIHPEWTVGQCDTERGSIAKLG